VVAKMATLKFPAGKIIWHTIFVCLQQHQYSKSKKGVPEPGDGSGTFGMCKHIPMPVKRTPIRSVMAAPILRSDHAGNHVFDAAEQHPAQRRSYTCQAWEDACQCAGSWITISSRIKLALKRAFHARRANNQPLEITNFYRLNTRLFGSRLTGIHQSNFELVCIQRITRPAAFVQIHA